MTKEQFENLKSMLASENVADMNLAGVLLANKLGLKMKAGKEAVSLSQLNKLLNIFGDNKIGYSPNRGKVHDVAALFYGCLVSKM